MTKKSKRQKVIDDTLKLGYTMEQILEIKSKTLSRAKKAWFEYMGLTGDRKTDWIIVRNYSHRNKRRYKRFMDHVD